MSLHKPGAASSSYTGLRASVMCPALYAKAIDLSGPSMWRTQLQCHAKLPSYTKRPQHAALPPQCMHDIPLWLLRAWDVLVASRARHLYRRKAKIGR